MSKALEWSQTDAMSSVMLATDMHVPHRTVNFAQARKRVAALKLEGAKLREQLGADIAQVTTNPASERHSDGTEHDGQVDQTTQGLHPHTRVLQANVSSCDMEAEIITVQAGIRGYLARKKVKGQRAAQAQMKSDCGELDSDLEAKVVRIQAGVRGHLARKQLAAMKVARL
jgi:IQ calmodulin-binding motif